jgi:hypothetical protein
MKTRRKQKSRKEYGNMSNGNMRKIELSEKELN